MIEQEQPRKGKFQEEFSPRAVEAFMSNYRDAQQAFLDLVDNAVDNRVEGAPLLIRIRINKNELDVYNEGGRGLDLQGLAEYFKWGHSSKTTDPHSIGFYGVGGKGAMGYLGRSMEIICSPRGQNIEYHAVDQNWETRSEEEKKEIDWESRRTSKTEGYFRARVTNIKKEVNARALVSKLGDIYRPLLLDGSVVMTVNNNRVEPINIKYMETDPQFRSQTLRVQTRFGDWVQIKVGILEEAQNVRPGIRCYYRGRLIEDEQFFGHPTPAQMPQSSRLTGEVHLDNVPVTPNKASFIRSSIEWEHSASRIRTVMTPWFEKLAKLKIEQSSQVENYEKELAKRVKRMLEHVFATSDIVSKPMIPGESFGRRPPNPRENPPTTPTGRKGGPGPQEGQTAPVMEAVVGQMKRWGAMYDWDVVAMGSNGKRSDVVEERNRQVLKINSDYPLYQVAKGAGDMALEMYVGDTAIRKISEIITRGKSVEEYEQMVDNLARNLGAFFQNRVNERVRRAARTRARTQNP